MKPIILDNIPFEPTPEAIQLVLDTKLGRRSAEPFQELLREAQEIAKPKALYKAVYVTEKGDDYIEAGDQIFKSRILLSNLGDVHRIFPYVATCGSELEDWMNAKEDILEQYYADAVNGMALDAAREHLTAHIEEQYGLGKTSSMAPGSLEDWPIYEQRPLFALLGDTDKAIGVLLLDSLLMNPGQTVSGIRFPSESTFESCQLCPKVKCPNRKAPYNAEEYAQRFS